MNNELKNYKNIITASVNMKGVLDIDSIKGCPAALKMYGKYGCYGLCYAAKTALFYGYDFSRGISRNITNRKQNQISLFYIPGNGGNKSIYNKVKQHSLSWFRIGTMGDPSFDWKLTTELCEWLSELKTAVIVTKHWNKINDDNLYRLKNCSVVFNTSISALDNDKQIKHRLNQYNRLADYGLISFLRIVTCKFGNTIIGEKMNKKQDELLKNKNIIDNPLRIPSNDSRVINGDIIVKKRHDLNKAVYVSLHDDNVFIGHCSKCPDQCGTTNTGGRNGTD